MGKGDNKTEKGKRFRKSYGKTRLRPGKKLKKAFLDIMGMKKWSIERIYLECGRYNNTVCVQLQDKSQSQLDYETYLTGEIYYTLEERTNLEREARQGFIKETNGNVKMRIILSENLTENQIKLLNKVGFPNTDIFSLVYYPSPQIVKFKEKGTKDLPKSNVTIEINSNFHDDCKTEWGFYHHRITNNEPVLDYEKLRYAALTKFLAIDKFDANFEKKYINLLNVYEFNYIFLKLKFYGNDITIEDKFLKSAIDIKFRKIQSIIENEFRAIKIPPTDMLSKHNKIFRQLCLIGMNFRPKIILFNDPLIHLTFESLIHILFRHTWDFRINENYGKKDVIPYKLQELEGLMTNVISELKSEIQHHYKTHPGKRFGKFKEEKYYYEGNYYHIHISPNGLIETFYCVNP